MKIKKGTCIATCAALVAAFAYGAYAEDAQDAKPDKSDFTSIDTNQDGQISVDEAREQSGWLARNFAMVDKDSNGQVSKAEFEEALS